MWQRNKKNMMVKVILLIMSLILLACLGVAIYKVRDKEESQDAQLMELYNQQQIEQQQARQALLDEVIESYNQDLETITEYLPGIVCWGDFLTGGTSGGVSYPGELQSLINKNICEQYDFRSTIKKADDFNNRLEWEKFTVEIPVINLGTGRESSDTILGRAGVVPFMVSKPFEIPAECESIPIQIKSSNGAKVTPLGQTDIGVNDVTISGVKGKLTPDTGFSYYNPKYLFTRNEPGQPVSVEEGELILVSGAEQYLDYLPVIFVGSFDGYKKPKELIDNIQALINRQNNKEKYIVIGTYYQGNPEWGGLMSRSSGSSLESAMVQAFGEHYINLRNYLANDCLTDLELKPTNEDINYMRSGIVPPSLLSKENTTELSPGAYKCLGKLVYDKMVSLGYLDEIVEELEIADFGKEIDPDAE